MYNTERSHIMIFQGLLITDYQIHSKGGAGLTPC